MGCACLIKNQNSTTYNSSNSTKMKNSVLSNRLSLGISDQINDKFIRNSNRRVCHYSTKKIVKNYNYLYYISPRNWIIIIDYLNFSELREIGKINRTLKYLVKNSKILVKFFRNKNFLKSLTNSKNHKEKLISIVQKNNSYSSHPTFKNILNSLHNSGQSGSINTLNSKRSIGRNTFQSSNSSEFGNENAKFINSFMYYYISSQSNSYMDYFTQNEINWNFVKSELHISESKSLGTPSFISYQSEEGFIFQRNNTIINGLKSMVDDDNMSTLQVINKIHSIFDSQNKLMTIEEEKRYK